jgi:hypothetical protein
MQYDVKSQHMNASGLAVPFRTRLKAFDLFANTATAAQSYFYDTNSISATYTRTTTVVTVTYENHGLYANQWVYLDFTAGTPGAAADGLYQVTGATANTFTITTVASGTITAGAVTAYLNVLLILDSISVSNQSLLIPGEGILARGGIQAALAANHSVTLYYG